MARETSRNRRGRVDRRLARRALGTPAGRHSRVLQRQPGGERKGRRRASGASRSKVWTPSLTRWTSSTYVRPTFAHKEGVLAAARASKPVVCEKPLARHLEDAREMVAACRAAGAPLFVAHVVRFFPAVRAGETGVGVGRVGRARRVALGKGRDVPAPRPGHLVQQLRKRRRRGPGFVHPRPRLRPLDARAGRAPLRAQASPLGAKA